MTPSTKGHKPGSGFQQQSAQPKAPADSVFNTDTTGGGDSTGGAGSSAPTSIPTVEDFERWAQEARGWFFELPSAGRVAVLALAVVVGFSLLRTVLEVVASLVSLTLLLLVAYVVYKIFIAGDWPAQNGDR